MYLVGLVTLRAMRGAAEGRTLESRGDIAALRVQAAADGQMVMEILAQAAPVKGSSTRKAGPIRARRIAVGAVVQWTMPVPP